MQILYAILFQSPLTAHYVNSTCTGSAYGAPIPAFRLMAQVALPWVATPDKYCLCAVCSDNDPGHRALAGADTGAGSLPPLTEIGDAAYYITWRW